MSPKKTYLEETILNVLQEHQGKENPITVHGLERMTLASSRKIRKAIANLVIHHEIPVASSVHYPYGFYFIADKQEAEDCLRQYWSRIAELSKRAKALNQTIRKEFGKDIQKEFEFR